MNVKLLESLLKADEALNYGWYDYGIMGEHGVSSDNILNILIKEGYGFNEDSKPDLVDIIKSISKSNGKSYAARVFALEAISCDLSAVASKLGILVNE